MDNKKIEYWRISDLANLSSMNANNFRAKREHERINNGENVEKVHSEALRDFKEIEKLILGGVTFLHKLGIDFSGFAADLGSGVGTGAAIISKLPEIKGIYAIEFSELFVKYLMPVVFSNYHADETKIVRVVGDFNDLKIKDESLSLIIEIHSFHHSENLNFTLKECFRVLKPGGVIISVDRAWPDFYTRRQLDEMLDKEYEPSKKDLFGVSRDQIYKRRDNGEHEYTIKEWIDYYMNNGFSVNVFSQVHPPAFNSILLSKIPTFTFTINFSVFLHRLGFKRYLIYGLSNTRKLFICRKLLTN